MFKVVFLNHVVPICLCFSSFFPSEWMATPSFWGSETQELFFTLFLSSPQTLLEATIIYLPENLNWLVISLFASAFAPLHNLTWMKLFDFISNSSLSYSLHWLPFTEHTKHVPTSGFCAFCILYLECSLLDRLPPHPE